MGSSHFVAECYDRKNVIFNEFMHSLSSGPSKLWRFEGLAYTRRPHDISKFCETLVVI